MIAVATSPSEILEQAAFFSSLTPAQRGRIAQIGDLLDYPSKCDIYKLGDKAECCYVLVRGVVRFKLELAGRSTPAGDFIRSGDLFGWAALLRNGQRRMGTASCVTPCSVLPINGDKLLQLMDADNTMGYRVMTQVSLLITSTLTALAAG
jgi:CRP-like cAMP-binding protein